MRITLTDIHGDRLVRGFGKKSYAEFKFPATLCTFGFC